MVSTAFGRHSRLVRFTTYVSTAERDISMSDDTTENEGMNVICVCICSFIEQVHWTLNTWYFHAVFVVIADFASLISSTVL